jgi:cytochrome c
MARSVTRVDRAGRRAHAKLWGAGLFALALLGASVCTAAGAEDDSNRAERLYVERCGGCHSLDEHGPGPKHRGLIGRRAGTLPGFEYSKALRESGLVWTAQLLDQWIADPNALVPGNRMVVQLASDPADRTAIVKYLASSK